jgi:hypothetical protein
MQFLRHNMKRILDLLLAAALLVAAPGCLAKASYFPNDHGGYTLMTAGSIDQVNTRFQRTARDLCPHQYVLEAPKLLDKGWNFSVVGNIAGGGSTYTVTTDLRCL